MDCPNCGAYNASSSTRCRRCGTVLQPESTEEEEQDDWGSSFTPDEDWNEWQHREREEETNPWAWSEPEASASEQEEPAEYGPASTYEAPDDQPSVSGTTGYSGTTDIPNYLWPSIGATLCCCAPLGIPAIIYASRVDTYAKNDDRKGALAASARAKNWLIASVVVAALFWVVFIATSSF